MDPAESVTSPWGLLSQIQLTPLERRKCEICGRRRNCAQIVTTTGPKWVCEKSCHLLVQTPYEAYLLAKYLAEHAPDPEEEPDDPWPVVQCEKCSAVSVGEYAECPECGDDWRPEDPDA